MYVWFCLVFLFCRIGPWVSIIAAIAVIGGLLLLFRAAIVRLLFLGVVLAGMVWYLFDETADIQTMQRCVVFFALWTTRSNTPQGERGAESYPSHAMPGHVAPTFIPHVHPSVKASKQPTTRSLWAPFPIYPFVHQLFVSTLQSYLLGSVLPSSGPPSCRMPCSGSYMSKTSNKKGADVEAGEAAHPLYRAAPRRRRRAPLPPSLTR